MGSQNQTRLSTHVIVGCIGYPVSLGNNLLSWWLKLSFPGRSHPHCHSWEPSSVFEQAAGCFVLAGYVTLSYHISYPCFTGGHEELMSSVVHSFHKLLLSSCHVPGNGLGAGDTAMTKTDQVVWETDNKQVLGRR